MTTNDVMRRVIERKGFMVNVRAGGCPGPICLDDVVAICFAGGLESVIGLGQLAGDGGPVAWMKVLANLAGPLGGGLDLPSSGDELGDFGGDCECVGFH